MSSVAPENTFVFVRIFFLEAARPVAPLLKGARRLEIAAGTE